MNSLRFITIGVFASAVAGMVLLVIDDSWPEVVGGAVLLVGSALVLVRHFWREGDKRVKRELAAQGRVMAGDSAGVRLALDKSVGDLNLGLEAVTERVDVFTRGVLEYMAQLQLESNKFSQEIQSRLDRGFADADRRAKGYRDDVLKQISGVIGVYSVLEPRLPYPSFAGFVVSGDCAQRLVNLVLTRRPSWVLEAGSGLSTVLMAQALDRLGEDGQVISFEHEKRWLEETLTLLADHKMAHRAQVHHTPLVDVSVGDETFPWYDLSGVELPGQVELIFVDGPPMATGAHARYPALPLLYDRMSTGAVLLMDDADRLEEREAIARWESEYPYITVRRHSDVRGTVEIVKGRP